MLKQGQVSRIKIQEFAAGLDVPGAVLALEDIQAWELKPGDGGAFQMRQVAGGWVKALGAEDGEKHLPAVRAFVLHCLVRYEGAIHSRFLRVRGLNG